MEEIRIALRLYPLSLSWENLSGTEQICPYLVHGKILLSDRNGLTADSHKGMNLKNIRWDERSQMQGSVYQKKFYQDYLREGERLTRKGFERISRR